MFFVQHKFSWLNIYSLKEAIEHYLEKYIYLKCDGKRQPNKIRKLQRQRNTLRNVRYFIRHNYTKHIGKNNSLTKNMFKFPISLHTVLRRRSWQSIFQIPWLSPILYETTMSVLATRIMPDCQFVSHTQKKSFWVNH